MGAPILVTGGTGMLGRQVVPRLLAAGPDVRVLRRSGCGGAESVNEGEGGASSRPVTWPRARALTPRWREPTSSCISPAASRATSKGTPPGPCSITGRAVGRRTWEEFLADPGEHTEQPVRRDLGSTCLKRMVARQLFKLLERYTPVGVEVVKVS